MNKDGIRGNETCCGENTCVDQINGFTCNCPQGMLGVDCCSSKCVNFFLLPNFVL